MDLITRLADAIEPSVFLPYSVQRTAQLSAFVQSGIVQNDAQFDMLVGRPGGTISGGNITMPFWTDLSGAADVISATGATTDAGKIDGTKKDVATKQGRRKKWSVGDLVDKLVDTEDPLTIIGDLMGAYWAREDQSLLINTLAGVFASGTMAGNTLSIATEDGNNASVDTNCPNNNTMIDAFQTLGDAKSKLTAIACHSATEAFLNKVDEVITIPASEGQPEIKTYKGKRLIIDDSMPVRNGTTSGKVYTTYLFGEGAIAWGEMDLTGTNVPGAAPGSSYGAELARDANMEATYVYFRRIFMMHPRGVKWIGTPAAEFPTNAELATGGNWSRVYENKNIRTVQFVHNLV